MLLFENFKNIVTRGICKIDLYQNEAHLVNSAKVNIITKQTNLSLRELRYSSALAPNI